MDRDRDRRGDRYSSSTYRPGRSPQPRERDSYASRAPPASDSYVPSSARSRARSRSIDRYRRRSRSPRRDEYRPRESESWRGSRARTPPRRGYSPRRDEYRRDTRARSPYRDGYGDSDYRRRSPPPRRESPPPLKRSREVSPARSRGYRSPPPAKRERIASPPPRSRYDAPPRSRYDSPPPRREYSPPRDSRLYRERSRTPRRESRPDPYTVDTWRRRSPSPVRAPYPSADNSGKDSGNTSRRSSPPPVHPSRMALVPEARSRPAESDTYPSRPRSPAYRGRSPERERSPPPPRRRITPPPEPSYGNGAPPTGPSRNGDYGYGRPPPTGPSASRNFSGPAAMSPPSGPSSSTMPVSAHSRVNPILSAPSRPRGRGDYPSEPRGFGRGFHGGPQPPPRRGSSQYGAGDSHTYYNNVSHRPIGRGGGPFGPPFRGSSNSTSTTYPRTQRFNTAVTAANPTEKYLSDLPKAAPGGEKAPPIVEDTKLRKLEEDLEKMRKTIAEKEAKNRQGMREYERMQRETDNAALRADLAEEHLKKLEGEDMGGAAF